MDLTTRCPECGTSFSVTLAQLQLRKGYIRCVGCASIFDGYESVVPSGKQVQPSQGASSHRVSEPDTVAATTSEPVIPSPGVVRQRASAAPEPGHVIPDPALKPDQSAGMARNFVISVPQARSSSEPRFTLGGPPATDAVSSRHSPDDAADDNPPVVSVRRRYVEHDANTPALYIEPRSHGSDNVPGFMRQTSATRRRIAGVFWGVLILAGLAIAVLQLAYVYRAQIASLYPPARPVMQRLCLSLGCTVPYARQIDHIVIMNSALRSGSAAVGGNQALPGAKGGSQAAAGDGGVSAGATKADSVVFSVVLRNTYNQPQEWPVLELSLTDFSGTLVARKNLSPALYLDAQQLAGPFPAGSEADVHIPLELKGLQVNGFEVKKFFP